MKRSIPAALTSPTQAPLHLCRSHRPVHAANSRSVSRSAKPNSSRPATRKAMSRATRKRRSEKSRKVTSGSRGCSKVSMRVVATAMATRLKVGAL
ncbi:hypothetical protein DM02DRAFT_202737 [Periconia macrospinosa]|uniref:Uncharacterized protein n=1 Tax=Periconia macrospinosa TaxID=97972 RepID=A0A2V1E0S6_9PLEO|nr:hypothetical protein DM02DRAFT_202737 [Periconia macrospinosa]